MHIEIQMIGTGAAFAKTYSNNSALVRRNGYALMIDFGITVPTALHRMNVPLNRIDGVFITHLHADHIGGLEELAFRMRYEYNKKLSLFIAKELVHPIWEHSLRAGLEYTVEGRQQLDSYFRVVPLEEGKPADIHPGLRLEILKTRHMPGMPSYSVILNETLFYSGDVTFDPDLIRYVLDRGCAYLLHDCQLEGPGVVHATLDELLTLPESIQQRMYLMHYGDNMEAYIGRTGRMTFLKQGETYSFPLNDRK